MRGWWAGGRVGRPAPAHLPARSALHTHQQPTPPPASPPSLFAGTNDNHRLLPQQVRQELEVEPGLRATNGRMLAVLLENPRYHTLAPGQVGGG